MAPSVDYTPSSPFQIGSGNRMGKYLETLMFQDYSFLHWHLTQIQKKMAPGGIKNRYHQHLEWLMKQGENRQAKMLCPICKTKPITQFSVVGNAKFGYSMGVYYSACDGDICRNRVEAMCPGKLPIWHDARFSSIGHFNSSSDRKMFVDILRQVFLLTKRLTPQKALQFFSE